MFSFLSYCEQWVCGLFSFCDLWPLRRKLCGGWIFFGNSYALAASGLLEDNLATGLILTGNLAASGLEHDLHAADLMVSALLAVENHSRLPSPSILLRSCVDDCVCLQKANITAREFHFRISVTTIPNKSLETKLLIFIQFKWRLFCCIASALQDLSFIVTNLEFEHSYFQKTFPLPFKSHPICWRGENKHSMNITPVQLRPVVCIF